MLLVMAEMRSVPSIVFFVSYLIILLYIGNQLSLTYFLTHRFVFHELWSEYFVFALNDVLVLQFFYISS